ncbi:MAG: ATP-binding protein [Anaeromyxobacteraceae bacterium]
MRGPRETGGAGRRRTAALPATVSLVAAAAVAALVGYLLLANFRSAVVLRDALAAQRRQQIESRAVALGHYLASAAEDLRYLAGSREVAAFYENRDLGMSLEYGLALSLVPIGERMRGMVEGPGSKLLAVAMVDADGQVLASAGPGPPRARSLARESPGATAGRSSQDGRRLVLSRQLRFKGRDVAEFVAALRPEGVFAAVAAGPGERADGSALAVLDDAGTLHVPPGAEGGLFAGPAAIAAVPPDGRMHALSEAEAGRGPLVASRVRVPGQPLSLVQVAPRAATAGEARSPVADAVSAALAAAVVLAALVAAVILNGKAIVLRVRLDESLLREREVAEKHLALEREVAERQRLEAEEGRLREQLRHAQKLEAVGRLAGGVAHDFNNILTVIKANAEFAVDAMAPTDPVRADVEEIQSGVTRASDLVRQLLAFSRKQVLKLEPLDLNLSVARVEKMLRRLIGESIELVTAPASPLGRVRADPGQIEQILVNLAVNARDAMPSGGRLSIATSQLDLDDAGVQRRGGTAPGAYVRLSVADTGSGMTPETMARIFEPFFTTKGQGKGTGLGLATVHGIVHQSGGFVDVRSAPGEGSAFDVYLPVWSGAPSVAAPASAAADATGRGETVLLVEDEPSVRTALARRLTRCGYHILSARDGEDALEVAARHDGAIDLLLSDVVMPRLGGPGLAARLRALRPGTAVVFMSGHSEEAIAGNGAVGDAAAFVQKPGDLDALPATLRRVLDAARPTSVIAPGPNER